MGSKCASESCYCGSAVTSTAGKVSKYGVFSGPYFPAFELNTERVSSSIHTKCRKIRTRKNSVFGQFSRSGVDFFKFPVTAIETELDYYQQKVNVLISSKAAKQH